MWSAPLCIITYSYLDSFYFGLPFFWSTSAMAISLISIILPDCLSFRVIKGAPLSTPKMECLDRHFKTEFRIGFSLTLDLYCSWNTCLTYPAFSYFYLHNLFSVRIGLWPFSPFLYPLEPNPKKHLSFLQVSQLLCLPPRNSVRLSPPSYLPFSHGIFRLLATFWLR